MRLRLLTVLCAVSATIGCGCLGGGGLPDNPPAYVESVYATDAGTNGISIYYILADADGQMTTSDGTAKVIVKNNGITWTLNYNVTKSDFQKAKVGRGAFEHEVILHNLGRKQLDRDLSGTATVELTFTTPEGKEMTGKTTTYY